MSKSRYKIQLKYHGESFNGWQCQADGTGVQDHLEKALSTALGTTIKTVGASRTDSGVHANHQVVVFDTSVPLDERRLTASLLALLPGTVGVTDLVKCAPDFHPIAHAKAKAYCYRFWLGRTRDPFWEPYVYRVQDDLDTASMGDVLPAFIGRHDFTAYCAVDSGAKTRQRTILDTRLVAADCRQELWILGEGFLKQMVRIIAGTVLEAGLGKKSLADIRNSLAGADRQAAGPTAPAKGLTLEHVFYESVDNRANWWTGRYRTP